MSVHGAESPGVPLYDEAARTYDALMVLSFGGPEGYEEVMPFLERVARGRRIRRERLEEVAHHYYDFGGMSPINGQNRALIAALEEELRGTGLALPVYFGNRNWHPLVEDTVRQMRDDGVRRALVFVTSAFGSYSGCRQYREDVIRAREAAGGEAPLFDKLRLYFNHPGFIDPMVERTLSALEALGDGQEQAHLLFTAHSIPMAMARHSAYVAQLEEASRLVAAGAGVSRFSLVYQSRSGPPEIPWLEPDVGDALKALRAKGVMYVALVPIGFISDHMEVMFDLDTDAMALAQQLRMRVVRAGTVGTHPRFVRMIRELIEERMSLNPARSALGEMTASHDECPVDCCMLRSVTSAGEA